MEGITMKVKRTAYKVTTAAEHEPAKAFYFQDAKKAEEELKSWLGYAHGTIVEQVFDDETFKVTETVIGRYWNGSETTAAGFYPQDEYDAMDEEFLARVRAKRVKR